MKTKEENRKKNQYAKSMKEEKIEREQTGERKKKSTGRGLNYKTHNTPESHPPQSPRAQK